MDGSASGGFSGGGLRPRPTVSTTRRRPPFVAPHPRPAMSCPGGDGSGSRRPSPGSGRSGGKMPSPSGGGSGGLPRQLLNAPPPRALSFTEPHTATWDADRITTSPTSPAEVYEVAGDDFSPNHWTPDYSQPRFSSAAGSGYFTGILTQDADDDLQLLNQQTVTPSTSGKGASKRGSNYSGLEDVQVCKSWIHISNDPIIGNDQSGKTYWERTNDFHSNRDFESDRTLNSLEHRFGIILKECMKFQGFYEEVKRRHPSGVPYQEHLLEAHAMYARGPKGKKFQFEEWAHVEAYSEVPINNGSQQEASQVQRPQPLHRNSTRE